MKGTYHPLGLPDVPYIRHVPYVGVLEDESLEYTHFIAEGSAGLACYGAVAVWIQWWPIYRLAVPSHPETPREQ